MENDKLSKSRDLSRSVRRITEIISSGKDTARWMSIDDFFSYYSPFSPFSEPKITMDPPDQDQGQINPEEVSFVL